MKAKTLATAKLMNKWDSLSLLNKYNIASVFFLQQNQQQKCSVFCSPSSNYLKLH